MFGQFLCWPLFAFTYPHISLLSANRLRLFKLRSLSKKKKKNVQVRTTELNLYSINHFDRILN